MFDHGDCRAYFDHVRLQFGHLHQLVEELKGKVTDASGSVTACDEARHLIADIADKFAAYVAEENAGGCLDEAVCRCPRLAPTEREIGLQYPQIADTIQRIDQLLAGRDMLGSSSRAREIVGQLAAALGKLESDVRNLLREAFGTDESFSSIR